jgi:hypothetical protein
MQGTHDITLASHHKPVLLALEYIGCGEFALRYSCKDSATFYEIKDVIMSFSRDERRWDPDECNGKGAWVVSETVLDELVKYFPSIPAWLQKATPSEQGQVKRDIE